MNYHSEHAAKQAVKALGLAPDAAISVADAEKLIADTLNSVFSDSSFIDALSKAIDDKRKRISTGYGIR